MDYRTRWELKHYRNSRTLERRMRLLHGMVILALVGFLLNFWYLQGAQGDRFRKLAETNRLRRIHVPPTRGVIYDRNDVVIAGIRPSLNLELTRDGNQRLDDQLARLAPLLDTSVEQLEARLRKIRKRPAHEALALREDVDLAVLARIEARRELYPSLAVEERARRFYPDGSLFGHLLGYVGEVSERALARSEGDLALGDIVGKTGAERTFDDRLRGRRGWNLVTVNNLGRPVGEPWVGQEPEHGVPQRLTVDARLQKSLVAGLSGESGAGVFLDPWTGEVLALASAPDFDPNAFVDGIVEAEWRAIRDDPGRPLHDRAVASPYAPGSTFKVVMAMAALESGTVEPTDTEYCPGHAEFYGRKRLCWKRGGHGTVDLRRALAESCNVYFYSLGKKLGIDTIATYGAAFGLGRPTGVELPGESAGILPDRAWKRRNRRAPWYPGDTISVAIGQGYLATTPLQMARVIGVVAADGWVARPVLDSGADRIGEQLDFGSESFVLVKRALRDAVLRGTARRAEVPGIGVAGKTGTAQVSGSSAGVDSSELPRHQRDHAWFVGYAPADHPEIAFAIIVEHAGHGGARAAPIARQVLEVFFRDRLPEAEPGTQAELLEEGDGGTATPAG